MSKKILITGASGGFGSLSVNELLQQGHEVWAAMRDPQHRNRQMADELEQAGAKVVELDVTDQASIDQALAKVVAEGGVPEVLIHNAGVGALGLQEAFTTEQLQALFDVNVFGVHRLTRSILPHWRQAGQGQLVFISSLLGRMTVPYYGPYNASKWALEAMAENFRSELSGFNIDVSIVEPGGFPTTFIDNLVKAADQPRLDELGAYAEAPLAFLQGFEQALAANPAQDPKLVAQAIAETIAAPVGQRPFRRVVDNMGMGDAIAGYNQQLHDLTQGIYSAFGIDHMLHINKKEAA